MSKVSIFLRGASVCLLAVNLTMAQASRSGSASVHRTSDAAVNTLSATQIAEKLAEAKSRLKSQNVLGESSSLMVAVATLNPRTSEIDIVTVAKESFLTEGGIFLLNTQKGKVVRLRIVRPNYVNTAVTTTDVATGRSLIPLLVKYPIEKGGIITENAYYTSAHPALITPAVVAEGHRYLATMFAQATAELKSNGLTIPADLVEVAKHLVIVEHTDHKRFRDEDDADIYPEVLALYALNQGNTFRYSVSSAGAGGMIQMIPKTYDAIRQHHPNVSLEADFVTGMQNHANALKAMLLYVNDTWNHLKQDDEVQEALRSGSATKTELLAAGYNSNPYRLPKYLNNGGSGWRALIPAETQMYLAIYQSVDSHVEFAAASSIADATTLTVSPSASLVSRTAATLISWVGNLLPSPALPSLTIP